MWVIYVRCIIRKLVSTLVQGTYLFDESIINKLYLIKF